VRSRLVGGLTENQIVQLSDLIAEKFDNAGFSPEAHGYCFTGTGREKQFNGDMLYSLSKGEYVRSA
jgi:hypothetical protein